MIAFEGVVTGGAGEAKGFVSLPGYRSRFRRRLGYEPFAGTLNVALEGMDSRAALAALDGIEIEGWEDDERSFGGVVCYPATVETAGEAYESTHVLVPERTHHEADQLELLAPDRLRDVLDLDDGDRLTVVVEEVPS